MKQVILSAVFLLLLVLPGVQMILPMVEENKLIGAQTVKDFPSFSYEGIMSGVMQQQLAEWFAAHIGFRGHLIRTDNQINVSVFKEMSKRSSSQIVLGRNAFLFEKPYINNYNRQDSVADAVLLEVAGKIAELQEKLRVRGVQFLVVISPSKASVYPENIPSRFVRRSRDLEPGNYERWTPMLAARGINYLDGRDFLLKLKQTERFPVYAASGTHWNYYAVCQFLTELSERLSELLGKQLAKVTWREARLEARPKGDDQDLLLFANLWRRAALFQPTPYAMTGNTRNGQEFRPRVLIVGASHVWQMLHILDKQRIFAQRDFYYYFRRKNSSPPLKEEALDPATINWQQDMLEKDVVILEINEAVIPSAGFGFVDAALGWLGR
ncbi:MAG: hypothetical protein PHC51_04220 [bacterium]|nr:hypothetical protein [bacterium]